MARKQLANVCWLRGWSSEDNGQETRRNQLCCSVTLQVMRAKKAIHFCCVPSTHCGCESSLSIRATGCSVSHKRTSKTLTLTEDLCYSCVIQKMTSDGEWSTWLGFKECFEPAAWLQTHLQVALLYYPLNSINVRTYSLAYSAIKTVLTMWTQRASTLLWDLAEVCSFFLPLMSLQGLRRFLSAKRSHVSREARPNPKLATAEETPTEELRHTNSQPTNTQQSQNTLHSAGLLRSSATFRQMHASVQRR